MLHPAAGLLQLQRSNKQVLTILIKSAYGLLSNFIPAFCSHEGLIVDRTQKVLSAFGKERRYFTQLNMLTL